MNQDQINITGMHSTVASYMDQNQTIWTGNKAFSASIVQLNTNNSVIAQKRDAQEQERRTRQTRRFRNHRVSVIGRRSFARMGPGITCLIPDGQSTSIRSTRVASPKPK